MAEQPPLSRIHVVGYSSNDRDFPIVSLVADPRVAGYQVPKDLSACPDKRYPNHVFTGAQPLSGDERVRHTWEILPSPYVPFTRYDDDLGPVQGRRRFVANSGQEATLERDRRVTFEAREGSAIVSTEIEESWDGGSTDLDVESPFPIKDRDFYDPSRGAVQERRQLVSTTGNEVATLENKEGVITQTSYEAYNEFISFKVVQTYSVDGPQLVGQATNDEGQLTTVTAQRKGADNYTPPSPTALRTVEVNREDAESLIERIVDTPKVFKASTFSIERPDPLPQKFRVLIPVTTEQETLAGAATVPTLSESNELSKSEQQVTEFVKRTTTTTRDVFNARTLTGKLYTQQLGGGLATVTETYPAGLSLTDTPEFGVVSDETEALGDGKTIRKQVKLQPRTVDLGEFTDEGERINVQSLAVLRGQEYDQELDIVIPYSQVVVNTSSSQEIIKSRRNRIDPQDPTHSLVVRFDVDDVQDSLDDYYWEIPDMINVSLPDKLLSVTLFADGSAAQSESLGFGDTFSISTTDKSSVGGTLSYNIQQGFQGVVPTIRAIFFLPKGSAAPQNVLARIRSEKDNDNIKFWPNARSTAHQIAIIEKSIEVSSSQSVSFDSGSSVSSTGGSVSTQIVNIPPTIHETISINSSSSEAGSVTVSPSVLAETEFAEFPTGLYLYQINATPYRFSYVRVDALLVQITDEYV